MPVDRESCTSQLVQVSGVCVTLSENTANQSNFTIQTSQFWSHAHRFLAPNRTAFYLLEANRMQFYSVQETCVHVTKIARFDWLAVFSADVILYLLSAMFVGKVSCTRRLHELASAF